ncbi:MAG: ribonuclease E inhibitor RraB [Fimbriimonadaceae bacterium]|nr:ribonuclease E inhibitor RraB [Fimbriimonadaceae bacterium]
MRLFSLAMGMILASCLACNRQEGTESSAPVVQGKSTTQHHIPIEELRQMFAGLRGQKDLDTDGPLVWGYFFVDRDQSQLHKLGEHLRQEGYLLVEVGPREGNVFCLHVERTERHTPESLDDRNTELERLADRFGIESYDGMDVGPLPKR